MYCPFSGRIQNARANDYSAATATVHGQPVNEFFEAHMPGEHTRVFTTPGQNHLFEALSVQNGLIDFRCRPGTGVFHFDHTPNAPVNMQVFPRHGTVSRHSGTSPLLRIGNRYYNRASIIVCATLDLPLLTPIYAHKIPGTPEGDYSFKYIYFPWLTGVFRRLMDPTTPRPPYLDDYWLVGARYRFVPLPDLDTGNSGKPQSIRHLLSSEQIEYSKTIPMLAYLLNKYPNQPL